MLTKYILKIQNNPDLVIFFVVIIILFLPIFFINLTYHQVQPYVDLARSFLHGSLNYIYPILGPGGGINSDLAFYHGKYFNAQGPFPSIFLMPFVLIGDLFGINVTQGILNIVLGILILITVYKISKNVGFSDTSSKWLAFAFCFGSPLAAILWISINWSFAHTISVALASLAVYEFLTKRRYWLIGIYCALIMGTRMTASLFFVFPLLYILFFEKTQRQEKFRNILHLLLPVIATGFLLGIYNLVRFDSFFEQGYSYHILMERSLQTARSAGLFSLVHLPMNIYYSLFNSPSPVFRDSVSHILSFPYIKNDPWGMSIFFSCPYLISLFFLKYRERLFIPIWIAITCIILPVYLFYGGGYSQFGYRYMLDFFPLLFLIFIKAYKDTNTELGMRMKVCFALTIILNYYLLYVSLK